MEPRKNKKSSNSHYINNKEFTAEIVSCKKTGNLSPKAVQYFTLLVERAILKLKFNNPLDKEDCMQSALMDLCRYWKNFDPDKSNNAFSYFTQCAKNGFAKEYKKIHKGLGKDDRIEFVSLSFQGDSEIFSL